MVKSPLCPSVALIYVIVVDAKIKRVEQRNARLPFPSFVIRDS